MKTSKSKKNVKATPKVKTTPKKEVILRRYVFVSLTHENGSVTFQPFSLSGEDASKAGIKSFSLKKADKGWKTSEVFKTRKDRDSAQQAAIEKIIGK